jgi:tetratricopeptide (TPR) repeat protein
VGSGGFFWGWFCRGVKAGKMLSMRALFILLALCCMVNFTVAQQQAPPDSTPPQSQSSSQADRKKSLERSAEAGESSSRNTRIDLSAPKDDAKDHPNSGAVAVHPDAAAAGDVAEMHSWNPYRAVKDDEVGDYYFKEKNYKAALARYQDALTYKENDAMANLRMGQCYEKLNQPDQAIVHYREYLKILPGGPFSKQARKALEKLGAMEKQPSSAPK